MNSTEHYCLDANVLIGPWNTSYPPHVFPTLWKNILEHKEKFIVLKEIYDEIDPPPKKLSNEEKKVKHPLRYWLDENGIEPIKTPSDVEYESLLLEKKYEIGSKNSSSGASQNDISLITYAKLNDTIVVTLEAKQNEDLMRNKGNYKIPLICKKENVRCLDYIEFLTELGIEI